MSKPKWEDAPEWAMWLAMDFDGEWYWFENEPSHNKDLGEWIAVGKSQLAGSSTTLEQRP